MADVLPIAFPIPSEPALINYNYIDISEGTGIITFYPFLALNANGMTTDTAMMSNVYSVVLASSSNYPAALVDTKNFYLRFNLPHVVKGTAFLNFNLGASSTGGNQAFVYVIATLYKYDSITTATTQLATNTCIAIGGVTLTYAVPQLMDFAIAETNFKKGDMLRLEMKLYVGTSAGTSYGGYGIDPSNSPDNNGHVVIPPGKSTQMILKVPFEINV